MFLGKQDKTLFLRELSAFRQAFAPVLEGLLPTPEAPEGRLYEAMRYAALGEGKRFRPFVLNEAARMFDVPEPSRFRVGAAIEMMHAYSLVHDDLPAMDNDELRRGRPTCHIAFDHATAILVGDALQALAFEVLASRETHPDADVRCTLALELAHAVGGGGMVGGQLIDLQGRRAATAAERRRLARMKTGALFAFSAGVGAVLGQAGGAAHRALSAFGSDLGLVFQTVDDLLDEEGDESEVGKRLRKDAEAGKATLVSLLGREGAWAEARETANSALGHLEMFGSRADSLRLATRFVLDRNQ